MWEGEPGLLCGIGTVSVYITACSGSSPWKPLYLFTLLYLPLHTLTILTHLPSLSHSSHLPSHPSHLPSLTPHTFPLTPHTFPLTPHIYLPSHSSHLPSLLTPSLSPLTPSLSPLTGVPIVHLITYPFPRVWHTANDNADAIDKTFVSNFRKILAVFLHEYFHLR